MSNTQIASHLLRHREHGLEMRALALAVDDAGLDALEAGALEEVVEIDLGKAEPDVGIHVACLLELMLEQVEDDDAAAALEDLVGGEDCLWRIGRRITGADLYRRIGV